MTNPIEFGADAPTSNVFPVVGIGASAGGLAAVKQVLEAVLKHHLM